MSDVLRISVPLTAWLASFSAVYGLEGLVCSPRWDQAALSLATGRAAMIALGLVALAIQVGFLLALRGSRFASPSPFMAAVSQGLALVALVATLWTLVPMATTSLCL